MSIVLTQFVLRCHHINNFDSIMYPKQLCILLMKVISLSTANKYDLQKNYLISLFLRRDDIDKINKSP